MATAKDLRRIALSLEGTTEAPHFDRTAYKAVKAVVWTYLRVPHVSRTRCSA